MKYVIVGYGRVGQRTARTLHSEGHDIVVVERDPDKADRARTEGFEVVEGDGSLEEVLLDAGIEDADAIGALSGDLNTNFSACMVGKHFGCRTVMRIDEDYREEIYDTYAGDVDEVIYPERVGAAGAKTALLGGDFNVLADLTEQLSVGTVSIPEDSPVIGKRVVEVDLPGEARIYAHGPRGKSMTIPLPRTTIAAGDSIAITATPQDIEAIRAHLRGEQAAT
jgi:trk system potassium uptake protein TrkA